MFIGREAELDELNVLYREDAFQLVVMYGRRRVGKTTLLNEFCKGKEAIFFPAEQSNDKLNLDKIQVNGAIFLWNMAEKTGGMACFADAEACFASK